MLPSIRARALILALILLSPFAAAAQEIVAPAVRDVTPPGFTPAPAGDGPLVREPMPPPEPEPARWRRYFLPVTTDAATFAVRGNLTIRIAGVTPPAADAVCTRADGSVWPCGRSALHRFRMFLGGRAVECLFPYAPSLVEVVAPCRIGRTDLGLWLARTGWARPNELATPDYVAAAEEARCAGRGLWMGTARPSECPPAAIR
jgi:endonuclease YncB( thermonuclease family)